MKETSKLKIDTWNDDVFEEESDDTGLGTESNDSESDFAMSY